MRSLRIGVDARGLEEPQGGFRRYTTSVLQALLELPAEVELVLYTTEPLGPAPLETGPSRPGRPDRVHLRPLGGSLTSWRRSRWENRLLPRALEADRADVCFAPVSACPRWPTGSTVVTVHDLAFLRWPSSVRWQHRRYWQRHAQRWPNATRLIAVSQTTADDLVDWCRVDRDRIHIVTEGVTLPFGPDSGHKDHRSDRPLRVLAVGVDGPRKNPAVLARAVAGLVRSGIEAELHVVGGGSHRLVRELGRLCPTLDWLGTVDDEELAALYRSADVVGVPSLYEGFGLPAVEAMACGTPVVVSAAGALPEVVGDAGIVVPPDDPSAWQAALRRLATEPGLAVALAARGLRRVGSFTWPRAAQETLAVLESAAAER